MVAPTENRMHLKQSIRRGIKDAGDLFRIFVKDVLDNLYEDLDRSVSPEEKLYQDQVRKVLTLFLALREDYNDIMELRMWREL